MDYSKYQKSRNLTWQILLDCHVNRLPVQISRICTMLNVPIISFEKGRTVLEQSKQFKHCADSDGLTFGGAIFYNQNCTPARQRFTVAHELGHVLLHNGSGTYNREPSENDIPIEHEANVFASRLLAPACVLWGLGVTNAAQISSLCNISMQSAEFRMKRLKLLYARETEYFGKYGRSCFLLSRAEREVYNQFLTYIEENKL